MCGRADDNFGPIGWQTLSELFGPLRWSMEFMRDEVRPTHQLKFVRRAAGGFEAPYGRWGLVPHGMGLDEAKKFATFNARIESLHEKPMFKGAFHSQRCVIPLAGFWEWPTSAGVKTKVRIARKDSKPLLVAGLWNCVQTPDGPLESCTIITRPPTPDLIDVHDRMPALLLSKDIDVWLDGGPHEARGVALTSWQPRILQVTQA
ncbi:SOS response-associated peptidase [Deinococcus sp. KSM4-11]|uniref:SOS response-associated peptidase n=1 Tax=Deinococcus sp. KSM4-11 TaxID=2568654 RepID=UPI0010A390F6|nr:SOS response-associated peptidase [Deinococcus sp. KSM4-11]THF88376.1 SOS response-associated peptidase [Deinococcus sp. KSM4-11]